MLNYTLPTGKSKDYAQRALNILKDIQELVPEVLEIILRSDIILTISGVRAHTTYIELSMFPDNIVDKLVSVLATHEIYIFPYVSKVVALKDEENWFIINQRALTELPQRYDCDLFPTNLKPINSYDSYTIWSSYVEYRVLRFLNDITNNASPALRKDMYSPHNIRFGMLLGYPGEAIISECSREESENNIDANIAYHDSYDAAWPVYSYCKDVKDNTNIVKHQKLWSEILSQVYESDWHKSYTSALV